MIEIHFDERVKIGLQYVLETLHGCSPFGQERIRRLRFYTPEERPELERELIFTRAPEDEMRMRVNQSGTNGFVSEVQHFIN